MLVLEERTYLVERNRKLEDENEDLRRLATQAPQQQGAMTQLFDELIHADDDADADRRRVERRGASTVRYFVSVESRMEKILRLRGIAARCRGWRTKLDGIGAPRSLRENLGRLKGLRNAAAHEVDWYRLPVERLGAAARLTLKLLAHLLEGSRLDVPTRFEFNPQLRDEVNARPIDFEEAILGKRGGAARTRFVAEAIANLPTT